MKNYLLKFLFYFHLLLLSASFVFAHELKPFKDCPGVTVAISRPGINSTQSPYQIYLVDATTGAVQASGNPINLQINAFGLNNEDGFLYALHESSNVANPFFARVDRNGDFEDVGRLLPPPASGNKTGIINTAGATMDDKDNYYFTAIVADTQNVLPTIELYVGIIGNVSKLKKGSGNINVTYKKISLGSCADELLLLLSVPGNGALQDFAFNVQNGNIYTYIPAQVGEPASGKLAYFNPSDITPIFTCIDPSQPNIPTRDLAGMFFDKGNDLFILTVDGNYYKANSGTGTVSLVTQTSLPLLGGNLRGDMASCVRKKKLVHFEGCPGLTVAISRPGINSTQTPYQIYTVNAATGTVQATGHAINFQINGFGLNSKDGFLYGMHESSNVFNPFLSRMDRNGDYEDIGTLSPPTASGSKTGIINTAGATMDGKDNYFFTAIVADTQNILQTVELYVGVIDKVSRLNVGSAINIKYKKINLGSCADELILALSAPGNGALQDFAFNPVNENIYTYLPAQAGSPATGKIAWFNTKLSNPVLNCIDPVQPNTTTLDLAGMMFDSHNDLFMLTIDGKYYKLNIATGIINLIAQTNLPLLSGNLRADMASCVKQGKGDKDDDDDDDDHHDNDHHDNDYHLRFKVSPNPVAGNEVVLNVKSRDNNNIEIRIIDAMNTIRLKVQIHISSGANQLRLNLATLPRGIYTVMLIPSSGKATSAKFIRL
jgi:hypothetical protein